MTIKLEVGKKYINRKGEFVTIIGCDTVSDIPFPHAGDNGEYYRENGGYYISCEDMCDLISEAVDPRDERIKELEDMNGLVVKQSNKAMMERDELQLRCKEWGHECHDLRTEIADLRDQFHQLQRDSVPVEITIDEAITALLKAGKTFTIHEKAEPIIVKQLWQSIIQNYNDGSGGPYISNWTVDREIGLSWAAQGSNEWRMMVVLRTDTYSDGKVVAVLEPAKGETK